MFDAVLHDPKLPLFLSSIDQHLAMQARAKGCPYCGGVLHSAAYIRKPRGLPAEERPGGKRESFCCHTCRRRTTPMSVRYLGRRVYAGAVVLLLSAMHSGVTTRHLEQLRGTLGVSRRTLQRWRHWWRTVFVITPFWRFAQGLLMPPRIAGSCPPACWNVFPNPMAQRDYFNACASLPP
jgi:hypothetical protein